MRPLAMLLLPALVLVVAAPAAPAAGAVHAVDVFDVGYEDSATGTFVTVAAVGDTVVWTWTEGKHTVTHGAIGALDPTVGGGFESGTLETGASFAHTFAQPGVYVYYCKFHLAMRGVVLVQ